MENTFNEIPKQEGGSLENNQSKQEGLDGAIEKESEKLGLEMSGFAEDVKGLTTNPVILDAKAFSEGGRGAAVIACAAFLEVMVVENGGAGFGHLLAEIQAGVATSTTDYILPLVISLGAICGSHLTYEAIKSKLEANKIRRENKTIRESAIAN